MTSDDQLQGTVVSLLNMETEAYCLPNAVSLFMLTFLIRVVDYHADHLFHMRKLPLPAPWSDARSPLLSLMICKFVDRTGQHEGSRHAVVVQYSHHKVGKLRLKVRDAAVRHVWGYILWRKYEVYQGWFSV